jgi:hypothetical protein
MRLPAALVLLLAGCALHAHVESPSADLPGTTVDCGASPAVTRAGFRHVSSRIVAELGDPGHRGIDLVASETDEIQTLGGKLAYGIFDKALEDEDVVVFACVDHAWHRLGAARTDEDGRFAMSLAGARRLPTGMRDLYAAAAGDGTGVRFLAYVAPRGARVIVTDVDGTLTRSEHAMFATILLGWDIDTQPGAPAALAGSAEPVVYVTARGDQYTEVTRAWLRRHGFPRGPLRLAPETLVPAGAPTVAYKAAVLRALHLPIAAAIGNRASDIAAYGEVGVSPDRIFIHLPEFADEVDGPIAAHKATAFTDYRRLAPAL